MNISDNFERNIRSVKKLINFDREVLSFAIDAVSELHHDISTRLKIENPQTNGRRALDILLGIRNNDSLKTSFSTINNQAVVLMVSYFGSACSDIFRYAAKIAVEKHQDKRVMGHENKFSISELTEYGENIGSYVGDILINKNDISFQDMKSISRAFGDYFGIQIPKSYIVNDIIVTQACRHSIVHEGGVVNKRIIKQIASAKPRKIKTDIYEGHQLAFSESEIEMASDSMISYVRDRCLDVSQYEQSI